MATSNNDSLRLQRDNFSVLPRSKGDARLAKKVAKIFKAMEKTALEEGWEHYE